MSIKECKAVCLTLFRTMIKAQSLSYARGFLLCHAWFTFDLYKRTIYMEGIKGERKGGREGRRKKNKRKNEIKTKQSKKTFGGPLVAQQKQSY